MGYKTKYLCIFLSLFASCMMFHPDSIRIEYLPPRETDVPGWKLLSHPATYNKDNLDNYIKDSGHLKLYEIYGFKELSIAKYTSYSDPGKEILTEVFSMDSHLDAFGILSMERPADIKKADVCHESYSTDIGIFAINGNYYIRVKATAPFKDMHDDIKKFLSQICGKIEDPDNSLPPYCSLFGKDAVLNLTYNIEGDARIRSLKKIFIKKIQFSGSEKTVFFIKRKSGYESVNEFSNILKDRENPFILSSAEKLQAAFRRLSDDEIIFVALYNEWIFGVMDADSMKQGEKIINYMYNILSHVQ